MVVLKRLPQKKKEVSNPMVQWSDPSCIFQTHGGGTGDCGKSITIKLAISYRVNKVLHDVLTAT